MCSFSFALLLFSLPFSCIPLSFSLSVMRLDEMRWGGKKKKSPDFFHPLIFISLHAALSVKSTCMFPNTRSGVPVPTWFDLTWGAAWNVSPPGSASGRCVQGEFRCVRNKGDCLFRRSCPLLADWVSEDMMDAKCL